MNRFMQFDEWTESVQRLDKQIESDFKSGEAQAAELFAQLSFWKKSIEQSHLARWEAMLYTCMGTIHYKNDPHGQAAGSWLRQAIQLEPEQPKAWLYLGRVILHELSSLFAGITMESIRQVDPTEHKKKKNIGNTAHGPANGNGYIGAGKRTAGRREARTAAHRKSIRFMGRSRALAGNAAALAA